MADDGCNGDGWEVSKYDIPSEGLSIGILAVDVEGSDEAMGDAPRRDAPDRNGGNLCASW